MPLILYGTIANMNQRIKDLMPKPWTYPYPDRDMYSREQLEQFAIDIITRCAIIATKCQNTNNEHPGAEILDYFNVE